MKSTIDSAGRVVIPKILRDRLSIGPNQAVEICERDGRIEIEPVRSQMKLVSQSGGVVAVPQEDLPPLTDEIVRATMERIRR